MEQWGSEQCVEHYIKMQRVISLPAIGTSLWEMQERWMLLLERLMGVALIIAVIHRKRKERWSKL